MGEGCLKVVDQSETLFYKTYDVLDDDRKETMCLASFPNLCFQNSAMFL
jgi:hypothetical protein